MGSHVVTLFLWLILKICQTIDTHGGYAWPYSPYTLFPSVQSGAARHDFHHSHNKGCYGSFTVFWDELMGTDAEFKKYQEKMKGL